jgi:hypothetical protein
MRWTLIPLILVIVVAVFAFSIVGTVLSIVGTIVLALLGAVFAVIGVFLKLLFTPFIGLIFLGALIWFLLYKRNGQAEPKA